MGSVAAQSAHSPGSTATASADFFAGGVYGSALDGLLQVADQPGTVATVIGPRGSGKTALCRNLAGAIDPSAALLRMNGSLVRSVRALNEWLQQTADADLTRVLVDDAHRLPRRCLRQLLRLAAEERLVLFLFGAWPLRTRLRGRSASGLPGRLRINLPTLTEDEQRAYLDWFLTTQVPEQATRPSAAELSAMLGASTRLPGAIEATALRRLAAPRSRRGAPRLLRLALVTVALASIGAVAFLASIRPSVAPPRPTDPTVPQTASAGLIAQPATELEVEAPVRATLETGHEIEMPGEIEAEHQAEVPAEIETARETEVPGDIESERAAGGEARVEVATHPVAEADPDLIARSPPGAAPHATPEASPEATESVAVAPTPSAGPTTAEPLAWVLAQPATHYTLQIAVVSSAERGRAYIRQQPNSAAYAIYPVQVAAELRHAILFGSFPTRAEAERAAADLPRSAGTSAPWIRRFSEIQPAARALAD